MRRIQQVMRFLKENDRYNINIILCAPKHQIYQFAIPTRKLGYLMGSLGILGLWSLTSLCWIIAERNINEMAEQRLVAANNALFDYQERYEHVVERSYNVDDRKMATSVTPLHAPDSTPLPAAVSPGAAAGGAITTPGSAPAGQTSKPTPRNPTSPKTATGSAFLQPDSTGAAFRAKLTGNIEKFDVNVASISYSLQRLDGSKVVRGFLWGYAMIEDQKGTIRYSVAPEKMVLYPPSEIPVDLHKTLHIQLASEQHGHLFFNLRLAPQESVTQIIMLVADEYGNVADKVTIGMELPFPTENTTISRSSSVEPSKEM